MTLGQTIRREEEVEASMGSIRGSFEGRNLLEKGRESKR
jgi:hypothetical protein